MHKVGGFRAKQIMEDGLHGKYIEQRVQPNTKMSLKIKERNDNRKSNLNPFNILRFITNYLGEEPTSLRRHQNEYAIQVNPNDQANKVQQLKDLKGHDCEIVECKCFNETKVVFYTYQHEFTNTEKFKEGLQEDYQITELVPAHWIKTKNMKATAFLAIFKGKDNPQYISIPGEQAKTKLYEHIPNPIRCNKCQSYGHAEKYCKAFVPICGKCSTPGHRVETCNNASIKCHHCSEPHYAGHRTCQKQKEGKAIMTLQVKERLTRREAIQRLDQINPDRHRNYAKVAKAKHRQEKANRESEDRQGRELRKT